MYKPEITLRVNEHLKEAQQYFDNDHIVGIFLQGSQNYGTDTEQSDIDTKLIVTPTVRDMIFNKRPTSTTHKTPNNEHIDFKDVRLYFDTFRQQNLNFLEILFTDYFIINPLYAKPWGKLLDIRERVVRYNPYRAALAMWGVATRQFNRVTKKAESNTELFDRFGYDPKALYNLLRIEDFLRKYTMEIFSYKECMTPQNTDFLLEVRNGYYYPNEAVDVAETTYKEVQNLMDVCSSKFPNEPNLNTEKLLKYIQIEIMEISMKGDLEI